MIMTLKVYGCRGLITHAMCLVLLMVFALLLLNHGRLWAAFICTYCVERDRIWGAFSGNPKLWRHWIH